MPVDISLDLALWSIAILVLAFVVRGIAGFGSGLIAIPLLALLHPLTLVVPVMALLDYTAAMTHGVHHRRRVQWRDLLPLLPFTLGGSLLALYVLHTVDTTLLTRLLGGFVLVYAAYSLSGATFRRQHGRGWAAPLGAVGGLVSTLFGTGGPFYVIYLQLRALDKQAFRASVAVVFMIDGGIRIAGYLATGLLDLTALLVTLAALPVTLLALYLGGRLHTGLSQDTFRRLISLLLVGSGAALLLR